MDLLTERFEESSSIRQGKFRSQLANRLAQMGANVKSDLGLNYLRRQPILS
jgi:hypothetical protein